MTWDDAVALALALPGTGLATSYGTPAVKVGVKADGTGGKLLIRLREDGDVVVGTADGLKEALIEAQPDVFHTTPHYAGCAAVLVRLAAADPEQLAGLIGQAWTRAAPARLRRARAAG